MNPLTDEFFKRNLSETEAQALEDLLEKSPEDALRFGEKFKKEYLAMGLVVPEIPRNFGPSAPVGLSLAKAGLVVLALAGAGTLAWVHWFQSSVSTLPQPRAVIPQTVARPRAVLPPPPLAIPQQLSGSAAEGNRLSVVVELEKSAPVRVSILGRDNQTVRSLYSGNLKPGKWSLHWDGLLNDGSKAPAGNYRIQVKSGSSEMSKTVSIE